ncbi:MAG: hypothetical protein MJ078_00630 [Clostridia bacterium]|nr:hypothetical protein [Clostridia bacterium]
MQKSEQGKVTDKAKARIRQKNEQGTRTNKAKEKSEQKRKDAGSRMEQDICPVILGADEDTYMLCRSFYTDFGIKSLVLDETFSPLFRKTAYADCRRLPRMCSEPLLMRILTDLGEAAPAKKMILLSFSPVYLAQLRRNAAFLGRLFLLPFGETTAVFDAAPAEKAYLSVYLSQSGEIAGVKAFPQTEEGRIWAYRTFPLTAAEKSFLQTRLPGERGFYTFALSDTELTQDSPLFRTDTPPRLLGMASDGSPAEALLYDLVLCRPLEDLLAEGIYLRFLPAPGKNRLPRNTLAVSPYSGVGETKAKNLLRRAARRGLSLF